jgi:hypothetical protein
MAKIKIITHGGRHHSDEILAIALVALMEKAHTKDLDIVQVDKCNPADFPDARFVVDVGGEHDPSRGWFDHHQFPKDAEPRCAFTLLAEHYGIDQARFPFMRKLAMLDAKGPFYWFEKTFGYRAKSRREVEARLNSSESVFGFFCDLADDNLLNAIKQAKAWLGRQLNSGKNDQKYIDAARAAMSILDMGSFKMAFFETRTARGVDEVLDDVVEADPAVIVAGMLDDRGDGFSAMRIADDPRVDFGPRAGEQGCLFAHSSGFCVKWANDREGFMGAVRRSVK